MTNNAAEMLYAVVIVCVAFITMPGKAAATLDVFGPGEMTFTLVGHIKCRQVIAFKVWFFKTGGQRTTNMNAITMQKESTQAKREKIFGKALSNE